jgi:hypothetical protein|tara:strand:- start:1675 stop:1968 length:294 start_codon:yes stop_codon:yes gene_type:complete
MKEDTDTVVEPVKIITGAVYQKELGGRKEQAVCLARIEENGKVYGLFRRFGLAFERFLEGGEDLMPWTILSKPAFEVKNVSPIPTPTSKKKSKNKGN